MFQYSHLLRRLKRVAGITLVTAMLISTLPETATAASTWSPTLLVNTESFQIIDSGDGSTNIELKFGNALDARLFYDITNNRFNFTKPVFIQGSLTATGSITTKGTLSGVTLIVSGVSSFSGAAVFKTNATVKGTISGSTLTVTNNASVSGALLVKGNIATKATLSGANFTFMGATSSYVLGSLGIGKSTAPKAKLDVVGTISGSELTISRNGAFSGSVVAEAGFSGSTFYGAGLGVCTGANNKLTYDPATGKFGCSSIPVSPTSFGTGNVISINNNYVKRAGDSMTGALSIDVRNGGLGTIGLNAINTISGAIIHAEKALTSSGTLTVKGNATVKGTLSGASLAVSGGATVSGALLVKGNIATKATLSGANFTFMGATNSYVLGSLGIGNTSPKAKLDVLGTISGSRLTISGNGSFSGALTGKSIVSKTSISGSTLTVDGNVTLHGVTYNAPSAQGTANTFLKNDGAGNLTWTATVNSGGSGGIISLHPQYTNAILFASGTIATTVGQLSASGNTLLNENFYFWTTSKAAIQDYWISVRVRLPDNFVAWDPAKSLEMRYRTADGVISNNHVSVRMKDTTGTLVALTNAGSATGGLVSAPNFQNANIITPTLSGAGWTPGGYVTIYIKLASKTLKFAEVGYLNLRFKTSTP